MRALLDSQDCWDIIKEGYVELENAAAEAGLTNEEKRVLKEAHKKDNRVVFFIFQGVDESTFEKISNAKTSTKHGKFCKNPFKEQKRPKRYVYKPLEPNLRR